MALNELERCTGEADCFGDGDGFVPGNEKGGDFIKNGTDGGGWEGGCHG